MCIHKLKANIYIYIYIPKKNNIYFNSNHIIFYMFLYGLLRVYLIKCFGDLKV